jgi:hypothetical protein
MACFHPVRPSVPRDHRVFNLEPPRSFLFEIDRASPLLHFDATEASSSYACHDPLRPMSTMVRKEPYLA